MKKKDMYLHENRQNIGHQPGRNTTATKKSLTNLPKTPKTKNGLFKPRLYGNIGKLSDGRAIGGLGITPQMKSHWGGRAMLPYVRRYTEPFFGF